MRIGLYIFSSIVFLIIIAVVTFIINSNTYNAQLFGFWLSLPVALWVVLPAFILMILSVLHMSYYGTKNFFVLRKWQKDSDSLSDLANWSMLGEPKQTNNISSNGLQSVASLLSNATIVPKSSYESNSEKTNDILNIIKDINGGTYVDLKAKKLSKQLSNTNPLVVKNSLNRLENDVKFAQDVLSSPSAYDASVVAKSLDLITKTQTMQTVKKYLPIMNDSSFENIVNRLNNGDSVGITEDSVMSIANGMKLSCVQFIQLAGAAMKYFDPKTMLSLFKTLEQSNANADMAYLYLLLDYEMVDKAQDFISSHAESDFKKLRIFFDLKQTKSNLKLQDLVSLNSLCDHA